MPFGDGCRHAEPLTALRGGAGSGPVRRPMRRKEKNRPDRRPEVDGADGVDDLAGAAGTANRVTRSCTQASSVSGNAAAVGPIITSLLDRSGNETETARLRWATTSEEFPIPAARSPTTTP